MPIMNYTTRIPAHQSLGEITALLAKNNATEIMTTFDSEGQPNGLKWRVRTPNGPTAFAMPVNIDAIFKTMTRDRVHVKNADARRVQATNTAWRIIKDWVEMQLALLQTEMVDMEELSLPYMLWGERTVYQTLQAGELQALQALP